MKFAVFAVSAALAAVSNASVSIADTNDLLRPVPEVTSVNLAPFQGLVNDTITFHGLHNDTVVTLAMNGTECIQAYDYTQTDDVVTLTIVNNCVACMSPNATQGCPGTKPNATLFAGHFNNFTEDMSLPESQYWLNKTSDDICGMHATVPTQLNFYGRFVMNTQSTNGTYQHSFYYGQSAEAVADESKEGDFYIGRTTYEGKINWGIVAGEITAPTYVDQTLNDTFVANIPTCVNASRCGFALSRF
mmetsp:Transcript_13187/g.23627  ORF Transcript_13187/g.23627 Transcript_13187/m.23627 type:complete len:246 (+) Transcript_13187:940-1677(+)